MDGRLENGTRVRITRQVSNYGQTGTIVRYDLWSSFPYWIKLDDGSFTPETRGGFDVIEEG